MGRVSDGGGIRKGKGIIMFCAWNDEDYTTWPANFKGVISVKSGEQKSQSEWFWEENKRNHAVFRGTKQRVKWKNNSQIFIGGSSFATALCTRKIISEVITGKLKKDFKEISNYLKVNASKINKIDLEMSHIIEWNNFHNKIKKVGLYPFFKEMHGFVRFRNELPYQIEWISNFKLSKNVGKSTKELLDNCVEDIVIQSGLPKDVSDIDTLIVGYLDKASRAQKKDLLNETLEYAVQHGLNVFSFLPPDKKEKWIADFSNKGLWLRFPSITYEYALEVLEKIPEKKAFDTPIIGVFGTSSKQGKFTLQLALKYELEKRGYKVGDRKSVV